MADNVKVSWIWIEVLTARQSILEYLLKTQEFEDGKIHGRVEAKATFVWSQGRVELHTISPVDLHLSLVVLPDDSKLYDSFRDGSDFEGGLVFRVLLEEG